MRFSGKVGYAANVETAPGVHVDQITERTQYGDVIRNSMKFQNGESVNNDLSVSNSISIVADEYVRDHFSGVRYVDWAGTKWSVVEIDLQHPRLILRLGGVYNGPTP
jgi:hypothetical protein